ncbi:unannotated protein [freshwater metagenome]|uniref:Unannotated protein n=1 Tax=freshwater metagenome TaxID=449393 RepID=A0A6J6M7U9_9ZZZZ
MWQQPRVRIRRKANTRSFLTEAIKLCFGQAPFQKSTCINSRGGVPLEENLISAAGMILTTEEMVEAHFIQRCTRRITRNVTTDANAGTLGAMHHDRCVPANDLSNAMFKSFITGELRFALGSNRVDVVRASQAWNTNIVFSCATQERQHDVPSAVISATCHHVVKRVNPLVRFVWIGIDILSRHAASQQGFAVTCGRHCLDPSLGRRPGSPGCRVTVCVPGHIFAYRGWDNQSWVTFVVLYGAVTCQSALGPVD